MSAKTAQSNLTDFDGVSESHVESYKSASDNKARAAVRAEVKSAQSAAMAKVGKEEASLVLAEITYWQRTMDALRTDKPESEKVTVPSHVTVAQRVAALRLAANLLESGEVLPEGITELDGDPSSVEFTEADAESIDATGRKLAASKITRSTERNSIRDAIERAFDGQPVGTVMKISEVATAGAVEGYKPSPGAIRATFGEDGTVEGFAFELVPAADGSPWSVKSV